jgi:SlyX protein
MEQRLTDMEMLIMHQGHVIGELNEVVTGHQSSIDHLELELRALKEYLRGMSSSASGAASEGEPPPPHY